MTTVDYYVLMLLLAVVSCKVINNLFASILVSRSRSSTIWNRISVYWNICQYKTKKMLLLYCSKLIKQKSNNIPLIIEPIIANKKKISVLVFIRFLCIWLKWNNIPLSYIETCLLLTIIGASCFYISIHHLIINWLKRDIQWMCSFVIIEKCLIELLRIMLHISVSFSNYTVTFEWDSRVSLIFIFCWFLNIIISCIFIAL